MNRGSNRELIASILYYDMNYNQREIAERMNVSTMTVSRLLESARQSGIVEIKINTPLSTDFREEKRLVGEFKLKKAIVISGEYQVDPLDSLARAAGFYLDALISSEDVLGITAGRIMRRVISALSLPTLPRLNNLSIVQLMGGFPNPSQFDPTTNVHQFVSRFGITGYFFHLPLYASNEEAGIALKDHGIPEAVFDMWKKCNITVTSVGEAGEESIYRMGNLLSRKEMERICAKGGVGDFLGRWFDLDGRFIDDDVNHRVLAIPIEMLKKVERKILVAGGSEKKQALLGILNSGLVDVLITDQKTSADLKK